MENVPKPGQEIPPVPSLTIQPPPAGQQSANEQNVKVKSHNYALGVVGLCIIIAILSPPSAAAQALAWPIIIFGGIGAIKFVYDSFISAGRATNALVKTFIILGGLGIGVVIFFAFMIVGAIVGFSKDPHPQSTG